MGGKKYFYLSGDHGAIRARRREEGLRVMKLKALIIIALYSETENTSPGAAVIVEGLGAKRATRLQLVTRADTIYKRERKDEKNFDL